MKLLRRTFTFMGFLGLIIMHHTMQSAQPWTWRYSKVFDQQELNVPGQHIVTLFKDTTPEFSQLVFNWNAKRPTQGYFSFWVQVHNKTKNSWSNWQKMMEWGANVQRSFASQGTVPNYCHVRLEMGNQRADGFRIKIIAHQGAILPDLKAVFITISDFDKLIPENAEIYRKNLESTLIPRVPQKSQFCLDHERKNALCSPTSCTILVSFLLGYEIDPIAFAENSYDFGLNIYGSWPFNMAHAFECGGGEYIFYVTRLESFMNLYQRLMQGVPVVVSVRGYLKGAPKVYEHGHLLVAVGWDAETQTVVCHDPALPTHDATMIRYPIQSFLEAWERSHRLAYIADPIDIKKRDNNF